MALPLPDPQHQSGPARRARREFASTEHLSTEALAAFVADQLSPTARSRALRHLGQCAECMAEIQVQRSARFMLRHSGPIRMPGSLVERLAQLPETMDQSASRHNTAPMDAPTGPPNPQPPESWREWWFSRET